MTYTKFRERVCDNNTGMTSEKLKLFMIKFVTFFLIASCSFTASAYICTRGNKVITWVSSLLLVALYLHSFKAMAEDSETFDYVYKFTRKFWALCSLLSLIIVTALYFLLWY